MSRYIQIPKFAGDWNNRSHGRRVQCPHCGRGFQTYIRLTAARCRCGYEMQVLTGNATRGSYSGAAKLAYRKAELDEIRQKTYQRVGSAVTGDYQ